MYKANGGEKKTSIKACGCRGDGRKMKECEAVFDKQVGE